MGFSRLVAASATRGILAAASVATVISAAAGLGEWVCRCRLTYAVIAADSGVGALVPRTG